MISEQRAADFRKNPRLEALLGELNGLLASAQAECNAPGASPRHPLVLVVGCPRSGTTLLMQWLAATGHFAYPSNFLSRFYAAPSVGARIEQMLRDPAYRVGAEFDEVAAEPDFGSVLGKTRGTWAPNEFWYFWRRFVPNEFPEFLDEAALGRIDARGLLAELAALERVFDRPWAMKGMILQQNAAYLAGALPPAVFLHVRRNPYHTMQSILEARERFFGDRRRWYSVKPRAFEALHKRDPFEQVAGQVWHVEQELSGQLQQVDAGRWLEIRYEDFCAHPARCYAGVRELLAGRGFELDRDYAGPARFDVANHDRRSDAERRQLIAAWRNVSGEQISP